jgi:putative thioredoxin
MDAAGFTIDVGDDDFASRVLEASKRTPVVVDFWAPWCGPCRSLGPLLEKLAAEHAGAFLLAKLNVDEAPRTAQRYAVRSIPAVIGVRDGAIVAEFVGAQPEANVRRFLAAVLPSESDQLARAADALAQAGDAAGAEAKLREALARDARHPRALLGLARLLGARGKAQDTQDALALLEKITGGEAELAEAEKLAARLRMSGVPAHDEAALRERIGRAPDDLAARIELGRALAASGRHEAALAELLAAVKRDAQFEDGAARKTMLDLFAVLGGDHPLTQRFRAELARALFR